ncbi:MAG TPA: alpha/beta fold hydrolase [Rudaea sp.]|jgi:acetyl esterase/lipase|nr:alpha/beta fold hydrolase [Rudaea sp.]
MTARLAMFVFVTCLAFTRAAAAAPPSIPTAVYRDPPADKAYPASGEGLRIPSGGAQMNAMVYVPAGRGPHPVAVLLHGFPGNEQNLDLAQSLRRSGWAVVTFHYRGSWGSEGTFTFDGAIEDTAAAIAWVRSPEAARHSRFDPKRIVVIGHSMGGFMAAQRCAADQALLGCVLLAPWDLSFDTRLLSKATDAERERSASEDFADVDGRLAGMNAHQVVETLMKNGNKWQLAAFAPNIAKRPALIVLATRDADDDKALDLLPALKAQHPKALRVETLDTDHGFNDQRIALQSLVLEWLAALPQRSTPP